MNILVIAGSPKGETSVTFQYVRALEAGFPEHAWTVVQAASGAARLERDRAAFDAFIEQARAAELILWACPVYVMLVPAGLMRILELVHERGAADAFRGKYAASLSTSIHFHDNCAHDYLRAVSEDLGMAFAGSFSPEMYDLTKPEGERRLLAFWRQVLLAAEQRQVLPRWNPPLRHAAWNYEPDPGGTKPPLLGRRALILHDADGDDGNLAGMVRRMAERFGGEVVVVNLRAMKIAGNCQGCLHCGYDNHCAFEGKDDFIDTYNRVFRQADLLVFAGAVRDRHLSAKWRQFFERSFFNTHQPSFAGKQIAFLVSGPAGQMANLREILASYAQWQEANLVDILSDEAGESSLLDAQIDALAERMAAAAEACYVRPFDSMGVGGRLVFREHIYARLRPVFAVDHRYYRRTGFYDFPTRRLGERLLNRVALGVFRIPAIRRAFQSHIKEGMLRPFAVRGGTAPGTILTP